MTTFPHHSIPSRECREFSAWCHLTFWWCSGARCCSEQRIHLLLCLTLTRCLPAQGCPFPAGMSPHAVSWDWLTAIWWLKGLMRYVSGPVFLALIYHEAWGIWIFLVKMFCKNSSSVSQVWRYAAYANVSQCSLARNSHVQLAELASNLQQPSTQECVCVLVCNVGAWAGFSSQSDWHFKGSPRRNHICCLLFLTRMFVGVDYSLWGGQNK